MAWRVTTAAALCVGVLSVASSPAVAGVADLPPAFVQSFTGNPAFDTPSGVVTVGGSVFVADQGSQRVSEISPVTGAEVRHWGGPGSAVGQFSLPSGLAADADGNLLVADTGNHRIQTLDVSVGTFGAWGSEGSGNRQFEYPSAVAVDGQGRVYVADSGNDRVQVLDAGGQYVAQWGGSGSGDGQFSGPNGIAVDRSDHVYVSDFGNGRVEVFDTGGTFLDAWGAPGTGAGQFDEPAGVGIDELGDVYVVDGGNGRVQKFHPDGTFLAQWGSAGNGAGQFAQPDFIALGPGGLVYVTDRDHHSVQQFRRTLGRPDGRIRRGSGGFHGDDVYNTTGEGQAATAAVSRGGTATFTVRAQNDGNTTQDLLLRGTASTDRFRIAYRQAGSGVTNAVTAGTFVLPAVPAGATRDLTVTVTALSGAPAGAKVKVKVSISSTLSSATRDVVKATVTRS